MKKILIIVAGFITAAAIYMGVIFAPEVKLFFTNLGKDTPTEVGGENNENGEVTGDVVADVQNSDMIRLTKMNKISANGSSLSVVATITPSYATNKTVSWDLAWKETNSVSVNDYVGISVSADTLTCNVSFKKGFDKQIILTCTANSNSSAKATCTIDYVGRNVGVVTADNSAYQLSDMTMDQFTSTIEQALNNTNTNGGSLVGTVKNVSILIDNEIECACGDVVFAPSEYDYVMEVDQFFHLVDIDYCDSTDITAYVSYDVYYGDTFISHISESQISFHYNFVNAVVNADNVSLNDSQLIF